MLPDWNMDMEQQYTQKSVLLKQSWISLNFTLLVLNNFLTYLLMKRGKFYSFKNISSILFKIIFHSTKI